MLQLRGSKPSDHVAPPACEWAFVQNPTQTARPTNGTPMKITTWNVNSFNVRLPQVQNWFTDHQPDMLVLRELKLDQGKFLATALQIMG